MQLVRHEHGELRAAVLLLEGRIDERHLELDHLNFHVIDCIHSRDNLGELSVRAAVAVEDDVLRKGATVPLELNEAVTDGLMHSKGYLLHTGLHDVDEHVQLLIAAALLEAEVA